MLGPLRNDVRLALVGQEMHFERLSLQVPEHAHEDLVSFYRANLATGENGDLRIGVTALSLEAVAGSPFYHLAFLVPGDRFDAALAWAQTRFPLLPDPGSGQVAFEFENWNARAFYFHDAASNIVELIAHAGVGENHESGPFNPSELLGLSEIGLVGNAAEIAAGLEELGLPLWAGATSQGQLAFLGERAQTVIVTEPARGWLPTGRPAEAHPVGVTIVGKPAAEITLGAHRIRCVPTAT